MTWSLSTDQMGNKVALPNPPQRIISLVPSQTELLFDLGLEERVVGITKFCVHPGRWQKLKTIVGGTKNFQFDIIERLQPDLIIGNKEENYLEGISRLQENYPLWMSDVTTFDDAVEMIHSISDLTDSQTRGVEIVQQIRHAFEGLKPLPAIRALYLMWRKPWMGAAGMTFINTLMARAGLFNVLQGQKRYPELTAEMIIRLQPSLVLLSSEPFPFTQKHIAEVCEILPHAVVRLVDGEMFSWYGSRLALAPAYFNSLKF